VRFSTRRINPTIEKPHGLDYALTLHGPGGIRLAGFDNAHAARHSGGPGGKSLGASDHRHYLGTVRPYRFKDAGTLLEDFWTLVDRVLKEKGVL
jgi:hypothetical protein